MGCELERLGVPPAAVVISHTLPPPVWRERMFSRGKQLEEVFGGLYEAWGVDAQSRAAFLESARADFEIAESYEPPAAKLSALACIIAGAADDMAPAPRLAGWDRLCASAMFYTAKGGHWDFLDHPTNRDLLRSVYARALDLPEPVAQALRPARDRSTSR